MIKHRAKHADLVAFIGYASQFKSDVCLFWPFGKNSAGYGHFVHNGKHTLAHRIVCEAANGVAPHPKAEAAHLCGNGHLGCVNPKHLAWKDRKGNAEDMTAHGRSQRGERHYQAVLTEENVHFIRRNYPAMTIAKIAKSLGVSRGVVTAVLRGASWSWLQTAERGVVFQDQEQAA